MKQPQTIYYNSFIGLGFEQPQCIGYTGLNNEVISKVDNGKPIEESSYLAFLNDSKCNYPYYTSDTYNFNESVRLSLNPAKSELYSFKNLCPNIFEQWEKQCNNWSNDILQLSWLDQYSQFAYFKAQIDEMLQNLLPDDKECILEICLSGGGAFAKMFKDLRNGELFEITCKKRIICVLLMAVFDAIKNNVFLKQKIASPQGKLILSIPFLKKDHCDLFDALNKDLEKDSKLKLVSNDNSEPSNQDADKTKICTYLNDNKAIPGNEGYAVGCESTSIIKTLCYYISYKANLSGDKTVGMGQFNSADPWQNAAFLNLTIDERLYFRI